MLAGVHAVDIEIAVAIGEVEVRILREVRGHQYNRVCRQDGCPRERCVGVCRNRMAAGAHRVHRELIDVVVARSPVVQQGHVGRIEVQCLGFRIGLHNFVGSESKAFSAGAEIVNLGNRRVKLAAGIIITEVDDLGTVRIVTVTVVSLHEG